MEWQPIKSAPRDGTVVDLWMVDDRDSVGRREANAYWVFDRGEQIIDYTDTGELIYSSRRRDGWWAPGHDYDGEDGFCDTPRRFNAHPLQRREIFTEATHWMPLPTPPEPTP